MLALPFGHLRPLYSRGAGFKLHRTDIGADGKLIYLVWDRVTAPLVNQLGFYDIQLVNIITNHLNTINTKQVFIDIGANQGLITLQVVNNSNFPENCRVVCLEPTKIFFENLEKNINIVNRFTNISLYNFGLNNFSESNQPIWRSNRNATATQNVNLSLDPIRKLKVENIEIIEVNCFVEKFLNCLPDEVLTIKSDTDGSDIIIFNSFLSSEVSTKIKCYILEVILTNISNKDIDIFLKNCDQFTQWVLKLSNNEIIKSKEIIVNLLNSERNLRGDLVLIK